MKALKPNRSPAAHRSTSKSEVYPVAKQAFVLAGGRGTRLGDLTRDLPKPMVPVGGKPFLEWLLLSLKHQGVQNFVLSTGYLSHKIEEYFGNGAKLGCRIIYSIEDTPLGTGGAIKKAAGLLEDTFLVISGDNFLELDYHAYLRRFQQAKDAVGMLSCWTNDPPLFQKNARYDESTGKILEYNFRDSRGKTHVDVGFKIFTRKLFSYFPAQDVFSIEMDVMPGLAKAGVLYGYPVKNPPLDVGTMEGLNHAREILTKGIGPHAQAQ